MNDDPNTVSKIELSRHCVLTALGVSTGLDVIGEHWGNNNNPGVRSEIWRINNIHGEILDWDTMQKLRCGIASPTYTVNDWSNTSQPRTDWGWKLGLSWKCSILHLSMLKKRNRGHNWWGEGSTTHVHFCWVTTVGIDNGINELLYDALLQHQ